MARPPDPKSSTADCLIRRIRQRGFDADQPVANKLLDHGIESLHSVLIALLHRVDQRLPFRLTFLDILARAHRRFQNLNRRDSSLPVAERNQSLRNDESKRLRDTRPDHFLFILGKHTDDAIHRF